MITLQVSSCFTLVSLPFLQPMSNLINCHCKVTWSSILWMCVFINCNPVALLFPFKSVRMGRRKSHSTWLLDSLTDLRAFGIQLNFEKTCYKQQEAATFQFQMPDREGKIQNKMNKWRRKRGEREKWSLLRMAKDGTKFHWTIKCTPGAICIMCQCNDVTGVQVLLGGRK